MISTANSHDSATPAGIGGNPPGPVAQRGGTKTWIVTFELAPPAIDDPPNHVIKSFPVHLLLKALRGHAPIASPLDTALSVTFAIDGTADTAMPKAIETLWTALEQCNCDGLDITKASLISADAVEQIRRTDGPLQLLSANECARVLQLSKQRISQLIDLGSFPAPDMSVGGRSAWYLETIRRFKESRRAARRPVKR